MSVQAIHILALLILFPATVASLVWMVMAWAMRGNWGVTARSGGIATISFLLCALALVYVLYHPQALPTLFSHVVLPPNPFKVN